MKSFYVIICSVLLHSVSFAGEALNDDTLKSIVPLREAALKSDLAYQILESLTTEVGPRMAGTQQDAMAVAWAENKFKSLGFDKVWKEPVKFPSWSRGLESAEILSPFPQKLHITALGNSVGTPENGLKGEIVHFRTFEDLNSADRKTVEGKIVFISYKMAKSRDGSTYGAAVAARSSGATVASKKGAIGIVIRSIGTDSHRLPHTGLMRYGKDVHPIPAAALSSPDADMLLRQVERGKPVNIQMTLTSRPGPEMTTYNVIGEITGREAPEEVIVIGGHLDSWDLGTGAVDDGAGVAITMAAAKIISNGERPRRTIRVVLWGNEEQGLWGARAYADAHKNEIKQHITGAESDFGAGPIWSFDWKVANDDDPVISQLGDLLKPLGVSVGRQNRATGGPDLWPLRGLGMSTFSLRQDGTDYFDLHHTADDTFDKINPKHLAQNVAVYVVFAYVAAEMKGDFGFDHKYN